MLAEQRVSALRKPTTATKQVKHMPQREEFVEEKFIYELIQKERVQWGYTTSSAAPHHCFTGFLGHAGGTRPLSLTSHATQTMLVNHPACAQLPPARLNPESRLTPPHLALTGSTSRREVNVSDHDEAQRCRERFADVLGDIHEEGTRRTAARRPVQPTIQARTTLAREPLPLSSSHLVRPSRARSRSRGLFRQSTCVSHTPYPHTSTVVPGPTQPSQPHTTHPYTQQEQRDCLDHHQPHTTQFYPQHERSSDRFDSTQALADSHLDYRDSAPPTIASSHTARTLAHHAATNSAATLPTSERTAWEVGVLAFEDRLRHKATAGHLGPSLTGVRAAAVHHTNLSAEPPYSPLLSPQPLALADAPAEEVERTCELMLYSEADAFFERHGFVSRRRRAWQAWRQTTTTAEYLRSRLEAGKGDRDVVSGHR